MSPFHFFEENANSMGLLSEVLSMAGGNVQGVQPQEHATALSAILDYVNVRRSVELLACRRCFSKADAAACSVPG